MTGGTQKAECDSQRPRFRQGTGPHWPLWGPLISPLNVHSSLEDQMDKKAGSPGYLVGMRHAIYLFLGDWLLLIRWGGAGTIREAWQEILSLAPSLF